MFEYIKNILNIFFTESWVDVTASTYSFQSGGTPGSVTPQLPAEEYLRLLREAQRESNQSSARVSLAGSRRDSPRSSPKSPPNSPVQGTPLIMEWQSYYMNSESKDVSYLGLITFCIITVLIIIFQQKSIKVSINYISWINN